jgi:hypothetical protein
VAKPSIPKIIVTHDYIRVSFGNNRNLSVSYGGEKASGAVPHHVFSLWSKAHLDDEQTLAHIGLKKGVTHKETVDAFVSHIDAIWPEWNVGPTLAAIGDTVTVDFGKRKGLDTGVVEKVRGTSITVLFKREGRISVPADMLVPKKA